MRDRRRQWVWGVIGMAILLLVVTLLLPEGRPVSLDRRLSTLRTTPDGAGALYALLQTLDIPEARRMTPLDGPAPLGRAVALLAPTMPLTLSERRALIDWIKGGGTLLATVGYGDALFADMGLAVQIVGGFDGASPWLAPGPWTEGVDSLGSVHVAIQVQDSTPLVDIQTVAALSSPADSARVDIVVLRARLGDGHVVLFSDPRLLTNEHIVGSGAGVLFARAAAAAVADGGEIQFDEYHQGYRGGSPTRAFFHFMFTRRPGWLLLQLLVVLLLASLPAAIRFGAPLVSTGSQHRSPLEHVAALGEVYRQAKASNLARRRLLVGFARQLGRDRPPRGREIDFLERLARGAPAGATAVAAVAQGWERGVPVTEFAARIDEALNRLKRTT